MTFQCSSALSPWRPSARSVRGVPRRAAAQDVGHGWLHARLGAGSRVFTLHEDQLKMIWEQVERWCAVPSEEEEEDEEEDDEEDEEEAQ